MPDGTNIKPYLKLKAAPLQKAHTLKQRREARMEIIRLSLSRGRINELEGSHIPLNRKRNEL